VRDIFNRNWFIATIATWIVVVVLDELVYYWWRDLNPGSMYTGIIAKHPPTTVAPMPDQTTLQGWSG
jgi:hypothetical protein